MHHTQIDRLWWQWQEKDLAVRELDYSGGSWNKTSSNAGGVASLDDVLPMLGLAKDITVREAMSTKKALFCYAY